MNREKVLIIDFGVGNHQSVANALEYLEYDYTLSQSVEDIKEAGVYILPGVGAFPEAMQNLNRLGLIEVLNREVLENKKPILGICLGMQIMADYSDEKGRTQGLSWIKGEVIEFDKRKGVRIPHVGWNTLDVKRQKLLFERTNSESSFYFDHSYRYVCEESYVAAQCTYGDEFVAAIQKDNIYGVQFHPEKSQNSGLKLFRSFFDSVGIKKRSLTHAA